MTTSEILIKLAKAVDSYQRSHLNDSEEARYNRFVEMGDAKNEAMEHIERELTRPEK